MKWLSSKLTFRDLFGGMVVGGQGICLPFARVLIATMNIYMYVGGKHKTVSYG